MTDEEGSKTLPKLSPRHEVFIETYLKCWSAVESYLVAFPKVTRATARNNGARLLADASIQAYKTARLAELHMGTDEALRLLSDMARGDIGDFIDDRHILDIEAARTQGKTKLIRKIRQRTTTKIGKGPTDEDTEITDTEIELYSAKDAIDTMLRVGGKLDPNVTINVNLTDD